MPDRLVARDGKSAYQLWLDAGNTGTQAQFLLSLKGATGSPGLNPRGAWAASTAYAVNDTFTQGGQTYRVTTAFTSGTTFSATNTEVLAAKGATGVSVTSSAINGSGRLILTFSDGSTSDAGPVPPGPAGSNATAYVLPRYTGGTIGRMVKQVTVAGAPAWADIQNGDQDLDVVGYLASDNLVYGPNGHAPLAAGTTLVANTTYRVAAPSGSGPNLTALESTEPTPTDSFTLLVVGKVNADKSRLMLVPQFLPLYVPRVVTPPGLMGEYKMLQTNEANKLYDNSGTASRSTYAFNNSNATYTTSGLKYIGEVNVDIAVPISDGIMTVYFAGIQDNLTANHTVFSTTDAIGDPHGYWAFKTDGSQEFYTQNNSGSSTNNRITAAGAASPAATLKQWCLVINGAAASLYDSSNTLVGSFTLAVAMRAFTNLWIGRRYYSGTPWIGTIEYFAVYHAAHTAGERTSGLNKMATAIAGRP